MAACRPWHILTGEYPPHAGGVSDYTRLVAESLAAAGDEVHVWVPAAAISDQNGGGLVVHRLPDHFGPRGLWQLNRELNRMPPEFRILVQYVPHAYGWKAMNVPFCLWLWSRRRRHEIVVMFHEVAFPWVPRGRVLRHNFLALVNRLMACLVARAASRIAVSIPAWKDMLRPYVGNRPITWLPIPSNVPSAVDPARTATLRQDLLRDEQGHVVGHFGTFGGRIARALLEVIPPILSANQRVTILLIGRGGKEFASELQGKYPDLANRMVATGQTEARDVADHLSACDLLIQPYPDGISSRRTTAMAGLVCGVPILTTAGHLTEALWAESGAVCLVGSTTELIERTSALLDDETERSRLGRAARALYEERFTLHHTISRLRAGV